MIDDISPPGSWVRELSARPHTYRDVWAALREAEARIAAVEAERDALRADAERYRWLRKTSEEYDGYHCFGDVRCVKGNSVDAAIDAARGGA